MLRSIRTPKKHLTEKQVLGAWFAVTECIRRESEDEPRRDGLPLDGFQMVEVWNLLRSN